MEVYAPFNHSACEDIQCSIGSSTDPHNQIQYSSADLCVNDSETQLNEILRIKDIGISSSTLSLSPGKNGTGNEVKESECTYSDKSTLSNSASVKCLSKCSSFPPFAGQRSCDDAAEVGKHQEDITDKASEASVSTESLHQCFPRSMSLPVPSKLVSAMKGSREKQGIPPKKLSVTWAPDVYDPIPTSVSHAPSNKNQRNYSNGRRSGKYKQKYRGKSSQGNKGKDKKQGQKNGKGGSNKVKPVHEHNGFSKLRVDSSADFDTGSPEPFCGSSFIKTSVTKLHFPVAEAS